MLSESGVHRTIVAFDRPRPCHSTRGRGDFAAANISPRAKLSSSNGEISFMVLLQLICSSGRIECQSDGQRNECLLLSDDLVCNKLRVCEARVQQRPTFGWSARPRAGSRVDSSTNLQQTGYSTEHIEVDSGDGATPVSGQQCYSSSFFSLYEDSYATLLKQQSHRRYPRPFQRTT